LLLWDLTATISVTPMKTWLKVFLVILIASGILINYINKEEPKDGSK
jgi:hypothetical protein